VISDFDRSLVINEHGFTTSSEGFSYPYASPEILGLGNLEESSPIQVTKPMDIYSMMMTILEVGGVCHPNSSFYQLTQHPLAATDRTPTVLSDEAVRTYCRGDRRGETATSS
jgi:hypothetical protein